MRRSFLGVFKPVIVPIGFLQDEIYCILLFEVRVKGRGVTEAWPILAEVKPYTLL